MIGISTVLFDIDGAFTFNNNQLNSEELTTANVTRRISKVKTLDGGVYIDDSGYVAGDTDINISALNMSQTLYKKLKDIFIYHGLVIITSIEGNFLCVPQTINLRSGTAVMVFATKESV